ncbi:MAG: hypothetical protein U0V70_03495 [Terriglobia bacterium]
MKCSLRKGSLARWPLSLPLILVLLLSGVAHVWGGSIIILKDGTRVEASSKPVSMEGQYRFNDSQGKFRTIPISQIDLRATEEANKGNSAPPPAKSKRVLTNDDIGTEASLSNPPASNGQVVNGPQPSHPAGTRENGTAVGENPQSEAYWRKRADDLRAKMGRVDKAIADLDEKTKSGKSEGIKIGFETYTPVILATFGDQRKALIQEKEKLQTQMNALEEEARKAGVQPGWLR